MTQEMSKELAIPGAGGGQIRNVPIPAADLAEADLEQLVEIISLEHEHVQHHASQLVAHAIRAGEALLVAKLRIPDGDWMNWTAINLPEMNHLAITNYMRIAHYQAQIPEDVYTLNDARRALRGLPDFDGGRRGGYLDRHGFPEELRQTARDLLAQGMSQAQVAEHLGVSQGSVSRWKRMVESRAYHREWDRQRNLRRKKAHAAREALRREQREKEIRKIGGPLAESYSRVRLTAQALQIALQENDDPHLTGHVRVALSKLYLVEDEIVKALRLQ